MLRGLVNKGKKKRKLEMLPYSRKQQMIMSWWAEGSPVKDNRFIIATGSARSGKTLAVIQSFQNWALHTFPLDEEHHFLLAGYSSHTVDRVIVPIFLEYLENKGLSYRYHRSKYEIYVGEHVYYIAGASNRKSQDKIQGMTISGVLADEVVLYDDTFVKQMIVRGASEPDNKVWMTCNPGSPQHPIKVDYIDKAKEKGVFVLHMTMEDNPVMTPKMIADITKLYSGVFYDRYIKGLWVGADDLIYPHFNRAKHVYSVSDEIGQQLEAKIHIVGVDHGMTNPTVYCLFGINQDNQYPLPQIWMEREYVWDSKDPNMPSAMTDVQLVKDLKEFLGGIDPHHIYVDPSAKTFINEMSAQGINCTRARNDVIAGIEKVSSVLETGVYRIEEGCKQTIKDYGLYSWDQNATALGKDKPSQFDDHTKDAERYAIYSQFWNTPLTYK